MIEIELPLREAEEVYLKAGALEENGHLYFSAGFAAHWEHDPSFSCYFEVKLGWWWAELGYHDDPYRREWERRVSESLKNDLEEDGEERPARRGRRRC